MVAKNIATSQSSEGFQLEVLQPRRSTKALAKLDAAPAASASRRKTNPWGSSASTRADETRPASCCVDENKTETPHHNDPDPLQPENSMEDLGDCELEIIPNGEHPETSHDDSETDEIEKDQELSQLGHTMMDICKELAQLPTKPLPHALVFRIKDLFRSFRTHTEWTTEEAEMAESILQRVVATDSSQLIRLNFISVINAYAKSSCAEKAHSMLDFMEHISENGRPDLHPNRMAINTVIRAYALSFEEGAANKAVDLLRRLESDYANGDTSRKPSSRSYGKVVDALAKHEEVERARDLLYEIQEQAKAEDSDTDLDTACYSPVIIAFLKRQRVHEAHDVLRNLLSLYRASGRDLPDGHVFFHLVRAWIKTQDQCRHDRLMYLVRTMREFGISWGYRTNSVLIPALVDSGLKRHVNKAEQLLKESIQSQTVTCGICYHVMNVIASQDKKNAANRCEQLLDLMETHRVIPDVRCFNGKYFTGARIQSSHNCLLLHLFHKRWSNSGNEGSLHQQSQ